MNRKKHVILLLTGIIAWTFFYIVGLPSDYFIQWSLEGKILLCFVTFFAVVPVVGSVVLILLAGDHMRTALWAALYFSLPLFVLDYIVVGIVQGAGIGFLASHWYISIAYLYVWFELPVIGMALRRLTTA